MLKHSKIKAENKRIIPKGALLYISFRNVYVRSSANEKSKILNKGFTLALHCSYADSTAAQRTDRQNRYL